MFFLYLQQCFSTISLKGAKSRPAILLESRTKKLPPSHLTRFVLFYCTNDAATQNIKGVTERHGLSKRILSQQRIKH